MSTRRISTFLIFIVFIIYISLGLPDSIMGSAWPAIRQTYSYPVDMIGILGAIQLGFSFSSTLVYPKLARHWTLDKFIIFSTILTVVGLIALGAGKTFWPMFISCVLLGFGQGSVDIAINDFSAKYFSNSLMNFLHGFYGIGVMASSFIMTFSMQGNNKWQLGVWIITLSQILILMLCFATRNRFKEKAESHTKEHSIKEQKLNFKYFILPLFYFFSTPSNLSSVAFILVLPSNTFTGQWPPEPQLPHFIGRGLPLDVFFNWLYCTFYVESYDYLCPLCHLTHWRGLGFYSTCSHSVSFWYPVGNRISPTLSYGNEKGI